MNWENWLETVQAPPLPHTARADPEFIDRGHRSATPALNRPSALQAPKLLDPIYATIVPSHRDRTEALTADLRRLGAVAAGSAGAAR